MTFGMVPKIVNSLLLLLQVAGLAVALGGVALLQWACNTGYREDDTYGVFGLGPNRVRDQVYDIQPYSRSTFYRYDWNNDLSKHCGNQYSWYWWVLAFQLLCAVCGMLVTFIALLGKAKLCVVALYAISCSQWCIFAYSMNLQLYVYQAWGNGIFSKNKWAQGYAVGTAGSIIVLVSNFIFLMVFSWDWSSTSAYETKDQAAQWQTTSSVNVYAGPPGAAAPYSVGQASAAALAYPGPPGHHGQHPGGQHNAPAGAPAAAIPNGYVGASGQWTYAPAPPSAAGHPQARPPTVDQGRGGYAGAQGQGHSGQSFEMQRPVV